MSLLLSVYFVWSLSLDYIYSAWGSAGWTITWVILGDSVLAVRGNTFIFPLHNLFLSPVAQIRSLYGNIRIKTAESAKLLEAWALELKKKKKKKSLLPHPIGQKASPDQPMFKGWRNRLHLLIGRAVKSVLKGYT